MHQRIYLSLLVALFLAVGPIARVGECVELSFAGAPAVVVSAEAADDTPSAKPKGNGFVRAITAPFRALGRLFSGGKKRDEAKKQRPVEETGARAVAAVTVVTGPREEVKPEKRKEPAAARHTTPTPVAARGEVKKTAAAPDRQIAPGGGVAAEATAEVGPSQGARVVRPAEGQPAPARLTPPKWIPVIEGIGRDPLTQGRALLQHGYPNEAVSELSIAAVNGPNLGEANNLLGLAYDRLGLHAQAIDAYERSLSAAPDDAQVLNNLGYSLFLVGRHAEALGRLKRAERLAPGSPYVLQNIAFVYARLGKYGDAFKTLARAFGDYDARLKTAELLEQAGRNDDALKHYDAALKLRPVSPALLERIIAIYERTGRTREAEAARRTLGQPPNKQKTATGGG
ncbi:MAG TPA: tetratricopeptide repeat protein, partial [Pyrinomonadaceae bacterium]